MIIIEAVTWSINREWLNAVCAENHLSITDQDATGDVVVFQKENYESAVALVDAIRAVERAAPIMIIAARDADVRSPFPNHVMYFDDLGQAECAISEILEYESRHAKSI